MSDLDPSSRDGARCLDRRALLTRAMAGALTLAVPIRLRAPDALGVGARVVSKPRPFAVRLPIPKVLTGANLNIPMREAAIAILPGRRTRMWTYGGSFPGPTIRRPAGKTTRVRFVHELGRKAGELTVHLRRTQPLERGRPAGRAHHPAVSGALLRPVGRPVGVGVR